MVVNGVQDSATYQVGNPNEILKTQKSTVLYGMVNLVPATLFQEIHIPPLKKLESSFELGQSCDSVCRRRNFLLPPGRPHTWPKVAFPKNGSALRAP